MTSLNEAETLMTRSEASYTCSFCKNPSEQVIAGPVVYICFTCATEYAEALAKGAEPTPSRLGRSLTCSFCGRAEPTVSRVVGSADAFVCNECLRLCKDIMGKPPA